MARSLVSGLFRYEESELDPVIHSEILLESARSEARVAILIIAVAIGFALYYRFQGAAVQATALFALITVVPLLVDAQLRRSAAKRIRGKGPQLPTRLRQQMPR
ncbi:MAG TPA: hypothetical protein VM327_00690 [Candidatus Thermoplasmatota archaeon]|nr:hypothetical protein [Candidatus Thermoplasmatota archaeon]